MNKIILCAILCCGSVVAADVKPSIKPVKPVTKPTIEERIVNFSKLIKHRLHLLLHDCHSKCIKVSGPELAEPKLKSVSLSKGPNI